MVKSFDDLLKENAFTAMKILDDIGDPSCPSSNDDILSSTGHHIQSHNVSLLSIPLFFFLNTFLKISPYYLHLCSSRIHQLIESDEPKMSWSN